jgi:hypothetical protein
MDALLNQAAKSKRFQAAMTAPVVVRLAAAVMATAGNTSSLCGVGWPTFRD